MPTVRIDRPAGNYEAGEDVLNFVNTATITGQYDSGSRILTLQGTDSLANYEAALRSITYENTSENPNTQTRTVSFSVTDGIDTSNVAGVAITPIAVNDAPEILGVQASGPNLVTNGGFEQGPNVVPFVELAAGSDQIPGWEIAAGTIDHVHGHWDAAEGDSNIDLHGRSNSVFQTSFATEVGQTYQVTFQMAANVFSAETIADLRVSAAGQSADFQFDRTDSSARNVQWAEKSFTFTAVAASTTLAFESLDNPAIFGGPAIDDVQVHEFNGVFATEGVAKAITGVQISDVDAAATDNFVVTLGVDHGVLVVDETVTGGVKAANVAGNGSAEVVLTGTLDAINATLDDGTGLNYVSHVNYAGKDTVTITANDQGATGVDPGSTGDGSSEEAVATLDIAVTANDEVDFAATFIREQAGLQSTLGWYDTQSGEGEILFSRIEAVGSAPTVIPNETQVSFTVDADQVDNVGYFLIPDGGRLNGLSTGAVEVSQLGNGRWVVSPEGESALLGVQSSGFGPEPLAYFTEVAKNPDGLDHVASLDVPFPSSAALAGDEADGLTGRQAWEDLFGGGDNDYTDPVVDVRRVEHGSEVNDTIIVDRGLAAELSNDQLQIEGRLGTDTLLLDESVDLDLTNVNKIQLDSIERIDLNSSHANELTLNLQDVLDLSETIDGDLAAAFAAQMPGVTVSDTENLLISGSSNDVVNLLPSGSGSWQKTGRSVEVDGQDHDVVNFTSGGNVLATVAIDSDVSLNTNGGVA